MNCWLFFLKVKNSTKFCFVALQKLTLRCNAIEITNVTVMFT